MIPSTQYSKQDKHTSLDNRNQNSGYLCSGEWLRNYIKEFCGNLCQQKLAATNLLPTESSNPLYSKRRNVIQVNSLQTKETQPSVKVEIVFKGDKGDVAFYRESSSPVSWLVHFYAHEESKSAVWLVQIALSWVVGFLSSTWLLWSHFDWSV